MISDAKADPGRQNRLTLLRGALCEYLDDGLVSGMIEDIRTILETEEADLLKKASFYGDAKDELLK
jgi:hypothetical protein